jgi:transposase
VRRLLGKVGKPGELRVCYEAGPTGYALYWQLTAMGIACEVIAPPLAPAKPGDRVKTDRRDAERLASSYQAGTLTVVWVPDPQHEALRDLVRAREAAKQDMKRAKHGLGKYLLRYGQRPGNGAKAWSNEFALRYYSKAVRLCGFSGMPHGCGRHHRKLGGLDTTSLGFAGHPPPCSRSLTGDAHCEFGRS